MEDEKIQMEDDDAGKRMQEEERKRKEKINKGKGELLSVTCRFSLLD